MCRPRTEKSRSLTTHTLPFLSPTKQLFPSMSLVGQGTESPLQSKLGIDSHNPPDNETSPNGYCLCPPPCPVLKPQSPLVRLYSGAQERGLYCLSTYWEGVTPELPRKTTWFWALCIDVYMSRCGVGVLWKMRWGLEQGCKQPGPLTIMPSLTLKSKSNRKNQSLDPNFRQDPSSFCSPSLGFSFSADKTRHGASPGKETSRKCNYTDRGWREMKKTEWHFDSKKVWGQTGIKLVCRLIISTLRLSAPRDQQRVVTAWALGTKEQPFLPQLSGHHTPAHVEVT